MSSSKRSKIENSNCKGQNDVEPVAADSRQKGVCIDQSNTENDESKMPPDYTSKPDKINLLGETKSHLSAFLTFVRFALV